jgi:branched-subunit amino acid aminotransferase/4-amino-4-deoxychorismate lyase
MKDFLYNGSWISENQQSLLVNNRSFLYGDGIFESIRVNKGELLNFEAHLDRIRLGLNTLLIDSPKEFISSEGLGNECLKVIEKSQYRNARIRINLFREEGGFYSPDGNGLNYTISIFPLDEPAYELNEQGYKAELYQGFKKSMNMLSSVKTCNALLYVLAGVEKNKLGLDEMILLNEKGNLCESISSNIFIVINGAVYTPELSEGPVAGVMRSKIISLLGSEKKKVNETTLRPMDLMRADEVFLSNAIQGIRWVSQIGKKEYGKEFSLWLSELIQP